MLFWERFTTLCTLHQTKPNPVAKEIGIASGTLSKWKEGKTFPNGETLIRISKHFDCSVDYLLGISKYINSSKSEISDDEMTLLKKIHSLDENNKAEIMMLIDYKLQQQNKEKESSFHSVLVNDDKIHENLA